MKLRKLNVATTAALAILGAGFQGQAQADAVAQSRLLISDFIITDGAGTALDTSAFSQISFTDTLTNTATLNGVSDFTIAQSNVLGATVNPAPACVGPCPADNAFGTLSAVPPPVSYARADNDLNGSPLTSGIAIPVAGANASSLAETVIAGTGIAGATSDIGLTSGITFILAKPATTLGLAFNADTLLRTWTSLDTISPSLAGADFKWQITLRQGDTVLIDWLPDGSVLNGTQLGLNVVTEDCNLNQNASATFSDPQGATTCNGVFEANTNFGLLAGVAYSFTIAQHNFAQVTSAIPEPGSVALMGIALAGFGAASRKRKAQQA